MKKRLTKGEKWLFAAPLLFVAIAFVVRQRQKTTPYSVELPVDFGVSGFEFSPDGKRFAAFFTDEKNRRVTGQIHDLDARIKISELNTASASLDGTRNKNYFTPSWSPDGKNVAAGFYSFYHVARKFSVWDVESGNLKADFPISPSKVRVSSEYIGYSSDGKTLISQGTPPVVIDASTGQALKASDSSGIGNKRPMFDSMLMSDEAQLGLRTLVKLRPNIYSISAIKVVDIKTKRVLWNPKLKNSRMFRWYGDILCVCDVVEPISGEPLSETSLMLWDGKNRRPLGFPPHPKGVRIFGFQLSPAHSSIAYYYMHPPMPVGGYVSHYDYELMVWDYRKKRLLWRQTIKDSLTTANWSPSGKWLSVFGSSNTVNGNNVYPLAIYDRTGKLRLEKDVMNLFNSWSSDEKQLATMKPITHRKFLNTTLSRGLEIQRLEE